MTNEAIKTDVLDGVMLMTLNRPKNGNSVDGQMRDGLAEAWLRARRDDTIGGVVVTGAGDRHFCTGRDLKWATQEAADPYAGPPFPDFWDLPKPVIIAINGVCGGSGFHFVWQSDFAIASDNAEFLEPHVSVSYVPVREMMGLAARMVPLSVLLRMAMLGTSERMSAERALMHGIVTEVVPAELLTARALELMQNILRQGPAAVRAIKEALQVGFGLEYAHGVAKTLASSVARGVIQGGQGTEGVSAFVEGRAPAWGS